MDGYLNKYPVQTAMLHLVRLSFYLLIAIMLSSCSHDRDYSHYTQKTKLFKDISEQTATKETYYSVLKAVNDSLHNWAIHRLKGHLRETLYDWRMDSLLCFNELADKCIMAELIRTTTISDAVVDNIMVIYGVKIKEEWYFFDGPGIMIPRENYQKDIHTPLSFEKLHEIAMENVFRGYLKKKDKGGDGETEWEINENWFKAHFESNTWCITCNTPKSLVQWDSIYLDIVKKNWSLRDTTNYEQSFTQ